MKNIFLILPLAYLCFSGCTNVTTVATKSQKPPKYTDSFINSEQDRVIGNLKFGMSENETKIEIEEFNKNSKRGYGNYIGNYQYMGIYPYFDGDKLYSIRIHGLNLDEKFSCYDLDDELVKTMEQKYGKADSSEFDTSRYVISLNRWVIGKKNIDIEITKIRDVLIEIYEPAIENDVLKRKEDREQFLKDSLAKSAKNVF